MGIRKLSEEISDQIRVKILHSVRCALAGMIMQAIYGNPQPQMM